MLARQVAQDLLHFVMNYLRLYYTVLHLSVCNFVKAAQDREVLSVEFA